MYLPPTQYEQSDTLHFHFFFFPFFVVFLFINITSIFIKSFLSIIFLIKKYFINKKYCIDPDENLWVQYRLCINSYKSEVSTTKGNPGY